MFVPRFPCLCPSFPVCVSLIISCVYVRFPYVCFAPVCLGLLLTYPCLRASVSPCFVLFCFVCYVGLVLGMLVASLFQCLWLLSHPLFGTFRLLHLKNFAFLSVLRAYTIIFTPLFFYRAFFVYVRECFQLFLLLWFIRVCMCPLSVCS